MTWTPITIEELKDLIHETEKELNAELLHFWMQIRINPEKWMEETYGEANGFWAVALIGRKVIWYNDIEEGFIISDYKVYSRIDEYLYNQDKLAWIVYRFIHIIQM